MTDQRLSAALDGLEFLSDRLDHYVFEDGSSGFDHLQPIREALATLADSPPKADAIDKALAQGFTDGWNAALAASPPTLDVERLAQMRDLVKDWLDAERLLDTMTIDDGPAHQDAWDAVHFTRERLAAEYARLVKTEEK